MKLNVAKCKREFPPVMIDNVPVDCIKSVRILGVSLQHNLKWNEHVTQIVKKAGKRLYMLRILKKSNANTDVWRTVFTTFIRPVLEYSCQVWHYNIPQYLSDEIEKIQKRACRIMDPSLSYRAARELTGLPLLKTRRENL